MPDLFKILARNLVLGVVAGWVTLFVLIATNTAGLYDIVFTSANPSLPITLLAFGFFITFGSLAMGAAIMMMPYGDSDGKNGGLKIHTMLASLKRFLPEAKSRSTLVPIPVKPKSRRSGFHR